VGAVVSPAHRSLVQQDPRTAWTGLIAACPEVAEKLEGVPAATEPPYDQVRVRKDYSYWKERFWTPGMVLVGDAACFVDPVLSSGVHLATYGALLAARSVNSCLDGMAEAESFAEFETRYRREYSLFYRFLISFYDLHRDEKSYFWSAKKLTNVDVGETAAFAELVAGLASADSGVSALSDWSAAATEFGQAVDAVSSQAMATADDEVNPLYASHVIGETFHEGKRLQDEARFGVEPGTGNGLETAKDGLG
jgi:halogenation protein CepH